MITREDLENYKKFAMVIREGHFDIKGSAIIRVALLTKWYDDLGKKLKAVSDKQEIDKVKATIRPIKKKKAAKNGL